jgi:hypothetical protein
MSPATITGVHVSDVGSHTADIAVDYTIKPEWLGKVKTIIPVFYMADISNITLKTSDINDLGYLDDGEDWRGLDTMDFLLNGGIDDDDMTPESYDRIYGAHTNPFVATVQNEEKIFAEATYRAWTGSDTDRENKAWDGQASGTLHHTVSGLQEGSSYSNRNLDVAKKDGYTNFFDMVQSSAADRIKNGGKAGDTYNPDMMMMQVALVVYYNEPVFPEMQEKVPNSFEIYGVNPWGEGMVADVPAFATTSEPVPPTGDETTLPDAGKDKVGVDSAPVAGSVSRVYINSLKQECKAKVDAGESCFWYSYIYSEPTQLTNPYGGPYVEIKKDDQGRYYYDVFIPQDKTGEHAISLVDENGEVQGWTKITVGKPAVNTAALQSAVNAASALKQADYTAESWAPFANALADAKALLASGPADQAAADAATKALTDAQGGLKKVEPVAPAPPQTPDGNSSDKTDKPLANTGTNLAGVGILALLLAACSVGITAFRRNRNRL